MKDKRLKTEKVIFVSTTTTTTTTMAFGSFIGSDNSTELTKNSSSTKTDEIQPK